MTLHRRLILSAILVACSVAIPSWAQDRVSGSDSVLFVPAVERTFEEAMKHFNEHQYRAALDGFGHVVELPRISHRTSAAYLMSAKSMYQIGEYQSSVSILRKFLSKFDKSEYIDDAEYTLGLDYYQLQQYRPSAESFLAASQSSGDSVLSSRAEKMLGIVVGGDLSIAETRALLGSARVPATKAILTIRLAEKILRTGDAVEASSLLRSVIAMPAPKSYVAEAEAGLERVKRGGVLKIGVVLPLSFKSDQSNARGLGQEMLDGMRIAVDEYNTDATSKVNLDVRDSERDAGVAARQVSDLSADDQVLAIVGPVFSNEVFSSAALAAKRGIPLITPTATSVGIAAIGNSIFQANPDFIMRGRAMAQYAALTLGAQNVAVLAASDTVDKVIVDAFTREAKSLGCSIVSTQWYTPGETDLRSGLAVMRRRGMELNEPTVINFGGKLRPADIRHMTTWGIPQAEIDSLTTAEAVVDVTTLFGESGVRIVDSMKIPTQRLKAKYDSLGYPVKGIDAIFASIANSDEIGIVTSQLRYFNFQTQLLGTGNWNDQFELDQNRQYANGVIFATDAYWDELDQQYQSFARSYKIGHFKEPSLNAMIGYDAMKLLLHAIRQGAADREELVAALRDSGALKGVHSKVDFDSGRVNSCLTIMQFKGRAVKKIAEIDVSKKLITSTE